MSKEITLPRPNARPTCAEAMIPPTGPDRHHRHRTLGRDLGVITPPFDCMIVRSRFGMLASASARNRRARELARCLRRTARTGSRRGLLLHSYRQSEHERAAARSCAACCRAYSLPRILANTASSNKDVHHRGQCHIAAKVGGYVRSLKASLAENRVSPAI